MYTSTELTTEQQNHRHIFIGLSNGNVNIFDIESKCMSSYFINFKKIFKQKEKDVVSSIKCHPEKMHRVLISYESTAAVVYSINKDRALWTLSIDVNAQSPSGFKGKLLAVEWFNETEILCGFENGHMEVYTFGGGVKPSKVLKFEVTGITRMKIEKFFRPSDATPLILMEYQIQ